jgi:rhodanese-related sulfurtransferase
METMMKLNDPARAAAYFESKLAFTTGPVELDRALKSGERIVVLDVREWDDFTKGHIPGAINLPHDRWERCEGLQRDRLNVIYCYTQTCHLAATAAVQFAKKGYPVMEMEGGFEAWEQADLEIEGEPLNRLKQATNRLFHRHS